MAKLGLVLPRLAMIFLALLALGSAAQADPREPELSPGVTPGGHDDDVPGEGLAPEPESESESSLYDRIDRCVDMLSRRCGQEIYRWVTEENDQGNVVSGACCQRLGEMGFECHMMLLGYVLQIQGDMNRAAPIIMRGRLVWRNCGLDNGSGVPAPSPSIN